MKRLDPLGDHYKKNHPWLDEQMTEEIFESSVRSAGDLAGAFEYDEDTGYFYLYRLAGKERRKIIDAIHVVSGPPDFTAGDVAVQWDRAERKVGLFIRGVLWAVFDGRDKIGGDYRPGETGPNLPSSARLGFDPLP